MFDFLLSTKSCPMPFFFFLVYVRKKNIHITYESKLDVMASPTIILLSPTFHSSACSTVRQDLCKCNTRQSHRVSCPMLLLDLALSNRVPFHWHVRYESCPNLIDPPRSCLNHFPYLSKSYFSMAILCGHLVER